MRVGKLRAVRPHVGEAFAGLLATDSGAIVRDIPQTCGFGSILRIDDGLDVFFRIEQRQSFAAPRATTALASSCSVMLSIGKSVDPRDGAKRPINPAAETETRDLQEAARTLGKSAG
jgi:hypothetical protein